MGNRAVITIDQEKVTSDLIKKAKTQIIELENYIRDNPEEKEKNIESLRFQKERLQELETRATKGIDDQIGIYLHWNGGRDSVEGFLKYCELRGFRNPEFDNYGWARLTQVITNYFGGELSVGVDLCKNLDCDNFDNGVYLIKDWKITGRMYAPTKEQKEYKLLEMVVDIDSAQPRIDQLGETKIKELLN